ncbi:MAG: RluA family pseudouridine synthase [Patescibacteria group bacterium]|nr:RluA family pseudouridine synthase [Patescibacteria group bacterium]
MDIGVIYEDDYLLVIDKPSGITVNRSDTTKDEETIQDWAEEKLRIDRAEVASENFRVHNAGNFFSKNDVNGANAHSENFGSSPHENLKEEFIKRAGIVHRLDKETSGILLIAKNPDVFLNLQSQFKERKVRKTYIALVHGIVRPEEGEIDVPLGRLSFNRKRFGVVAGGRESTTRYKVLTIKYLMTGKREEVLSLLELNPKTGRTHQIRVHLKYFNHPVFADSLYAGRKTARGDRKLLPRLFLHAAKISFEHPRTKKIISFESPLPEQLENFLKNRTA